MPSSSATPATISAMIGSVELELPPVAVRLIQRFPWACWVAAFGAVTMGAAYWQHAHRYDAYTAGYYLVERRLLRFKNGFRRARP